MIEFQKVSVCYEPGARHPQHAIEDISLKIEKGEWVFLVGPSGAGKSTLLKLLHCGTPASARVEGRVLLNGQNITHLAAREIPFVRRKIGVVFQDFQLLAQKTAWENIAFALRVIGEKQNRIAREVPRALDIVGLAHRAHAQPHELSGGEQQRIAIARAIVNDPDLLLADEPTGNLDPQTAEGIAEVLRRVNEERGTTVVMATHDRHLVDTLRKRVIRVRDGKIASDEASGVYHPEDDLPSNRQQAEAASASTPAASPTPAPPTNVPPTTAPRALNGSVSKATPIVVTSTPPAPVSAPAPAPAKEIEAPPVREQSTAPAEMSAPVEAARTEPLSQVHPAPGAQETVQPLPRVRLQEPQDAITREALGNTAPLGSDENPIVQYGNRN